MTSMLDRNPSRRSAPPRLARTCFAACVAAGVLVPGSAEAAVPGIESPGAMVSTDAAPSVEPNEADVALGETQAWAATQLGLVRDTLRELENRAPTVLADLSTIRRELAATYEAVPSADIESLVRLDGAAVDAAFRVSEVTDPFFVAFERASSTLDAVRLEARRRLRPWLPRLEDHVRELEASVDAARSRCREMPAGIVAARTLAMADAQSARLAIQRRRELLLANTLDGETLRRMEKAQGAQLAGWFADRVAALVEPLWEAQPAGPEGLSYLLGQTVRLQGFVEAFGAHPICATRPAFAGLGCQALESNVARARVYVRDTVPVLVSLGADVLASKRPDEEAVVRLRGTLAAGHVLEAVALHDALLTTLAFAPVPGPGVSP